MAVKQPHLKNLIPIYSDGYHNAFTDLIFWKDHYYVAFRQSESHDVYLPGEIIIIRAHKDKYKDKNDWHKVAVISTQGDDRDPKFFVHRGKTTERLCVFFGTYYPRWPGFSGIVQGDITSSTYDLITHVSYTRDGALWATPVQVSRPNYWIWSVISLEGRKSFKGYFNSLGCAYHFGGPKDDCHSLHLLCAEDDFINWYTRGTMIDGGYNFKPSEPTLYLKSDTLYCFARVDNQKSIVGKATLKKEFRDWHWRQLPYEIHCPIVKPYKDGWIIAGRKVRENDDLYDDKELGLEFSLYDERDWKKIEDRDREKYKCALYYTEEPRSSSRDWDAEELLVLPSGKDCAYPGLCYKETTKEGVSFLVSYYSQHETQKYLIGLPHEASIYLAEVVLP